MGSRLHMGMAAFRCACFDGPYLNLFKPQLQWAAAASSASPAAAAAAEDDGGGGGMSAGATHSGSEICSGTLMVLSSGWFRSVWDRMDVQLTHQALQLFKPASGADRRMRHAPSVASHPLAVYRTEPTLAHGCPRRDFACGGRSLEQGNANR